MNKHHATKISLIIALLIAGAVSISAAYIEDREAAMKLKRQGETEAALEAFQKMAEADVTEVQKSDALEQAVLCLIKMKDYENAKEKADQIPIQGVSDLCHMRILNAQGKHKAIIEQFGDAKINEWPPMWRGHGYVLRGNAAHRTGKGELAASDLEEAMVYAATFGNLKHDKSRALNALGQIYRDLLKDDEKAIDAFRRAQQVGANSKGTRATFAIADIYLEQDKPDKAVAVVKDWTEKVTPQSFGSAYWQKSLLTGAVRVFVAADRKEEAVAACKEALAADKIKPKVKDYCRKKLAELQGKDAGAENDGEK
ncbi:MAG: tetratricopeptide repeat protein [Lentisphaeria bacterium]